MIGIDMMTTCAPNVAPATLEKVIQVESGGNPLALNVNIKWVTERDKKGNPIMVMNEDGQLKPKRHKVVFKNPIAIKTAQDAVTVAYMAIDAGHTVDMGYMQVNSSNLKSLGYRVEDMFDPCKNLAAGARVLSAFYSNALPEYPNEQGALRAALSAYNTGDFNKGFLNGYLARYGVGQQTVVSIPALNPFTAPTAVFVRQQRKETVMSTKEERPSKEVTEVKAISSPRVDPIVSTSVEDGSTPGVQVEHTAAEAEANGAFQETAISEAEAWASNADLAADPEGTAIVVNGKAVRKGGN